MPHSVLINDKLYDEIKAYCDLNNIKPSTLCNDLLKKSLMELKYGDIPFGVIKNEQINDHISERVIEQINEIPLTPITDEVMPEITEPEHNEQQIANVEPEPKKEEKKTTTKKVRVLK